MRVEEIEEEDYKRFYNVYKYRSYVTQECKNDITYLCKRYKLKPDGKCPNCDGCGVTKKMKEVINTIVEFKKRIDIYKNGV